MAIRITLECGHTSELRAQRTPEGYTHDWQVFIRGVDNAEIHQYIERVVFHLHETFPKPKRVVKEPPYVVKESGYAGFEIPIVVYLKNKDEPKRFHFSYDLNLQPSGPAINKVVLHSENFPNPNDEFRKKLLKGGAVMVTNSEGTPEKSKVTPLMVGKPKLSGTEGKKYRMSEPKGSNAFADLFGPPIKTAGTKVSPDTKKPSSSTSSSSSSSSSDKTSSIKLSSSEKIEKSDKSSKAKHSPHKDGKKEKNSEERKEKKDKDSSKEKEKNKEKLKKSQSPTNKSSHTSSPGTKRPASPSPIKKPSTPPPSQPSKRPPSPKPRDKESKKITQEKDKEKEKEKVKESSKNTSDDSRTEKKKDKKKHKEEKEKEKKDKHKDRERDKSKDSKDTKNIEKKVIDKSEKPEKIEKEKITQEFKQSKDGRKSPKPIKEMEKLSKEEKPPKLEKMEKTEKIEKSKDSKDSKEKHKSKHKKREKKDKRDGSKERDKKEKRDKNRSSSEKPNNNVSIPRVTPVTTNPLSTLLAEMPDRDSSDSAPSLDDEPIITEPKPITTIKKEPPALIATAAATVSNESKPIMSPPPVSDKKNRSDRTKREKSSKGNREEKETKKRKRRSDSKGDDERAIKKERDQSASPLVEPVSSSQSPIAVDMENVHHQKIKEEGASRKQTTATTGKGSEGEAEQVAPDSTNSTLVEPETADTSSFSQEYVSQLKDLQHKIMTIEDNQELQRLVEVIAETGQYEVTKKTFDFDLCALDRRTVQRLQQFFAS
ncbi:protein AF-9 [Leptopilina boulardi]|uniref:protein AF-9 n=1 Tax=Leptopilina boulardi TaxID=63433 RepID=UPI0021F655BB|nr:protein AF-9 [Leptopilina boulardi]